MRLPALALGVLLLLSACTSEADSSPPSGDSTGVLVDMDVGSGDLDALRTLQADQGVHVTAVSLSLTSGLGCEDGAAAVAAVLAEEGREGVPIACGPTESIDGSVDPPQPRDAAGEFDTDADVATAGLAELDDAVLNAADQILVLGPMTNVASLLERLPAAPITFVAGPETSGSPASIAADPRAARNVIEQHTVTMVQETAVPDLTAEVVTAWLVIDESLGSYAVEDITVTSSGDIVPAEGGATVRRLDSVDTERLIALSEDAQPVEETTAKGLELRWRVDVGRAEIGYHKRAAVAGEVVIVGGDGQAHGISLATGELAWTVETGTDGPTGASVAHQDGVAVLSRELAFPIPLGRELVAIDVDDRSVLWDFDPQTILPDSDLVSSPAIAGELVYAGTATLPSDGSGSIALGEGTIFALDLHTGELVWESDGFGGASEPTVAGDDLVVGGADGTLRVLDRHTGELRWERDLEVVALNGIASRPLVADGVVYVTGDDGTVHAVDQESGDVIWRSRRAPSPYRRPPSWPTDG